MLYEKIEDTHEIVRHLSHPLRHNQMGPPGSFIAGDSGVQEIHEFLSDHQEV